MRAIEARQELVGQVQLRREQVFQPVDRLALFRRLSSNLFAVARCDIAVPPVADAHVAEPKQQAQAKVGARSQTGRKRRTQDGYPLPEAERFRVEQAFAE